MKPSVKKRYLIIATAASLVVLSLITVFRHGYDTTLLLADLAHMNVPLPDVRSGYKRSEVDFSTSHKTHAADLYVPLGLARAGIILVPGAAEDGRNDSRLVEFAVALARSDFVVLVPDIVSMRELRPSPESAAEIAAAVSYLRSARILAPGDRVGIGAFSIAAGPAVLAALNPEGGSQINFLFLVGGYYDMRRTLTFLTTGYFEDAGQSLHREPNTYGKWVYALSNASRLKDPSDRDALSAIAWHKLNGQEAEAAQLLTRLSTEGRAVYEFIVNADPEKVPGLMRKLPEAVRDDIDALNLAAYDLSKLQAHFILVHGIDDDIIPYTESVSLAAALPPGNAKLYLLDGLHHVDQDLHGRDAWRSWRAMQALLMQRD